MKMTYDPEVDAAYLLLGDPIGAGQASRQVVVEETPNGASQVNLDFDAQGRLLGVEVLTASLALEKSLLDQAPLP